MTALSIESVDKVYSRRGRPPVHAVKNLSMAIEEEEIVALLGSSGCGKTSTLRMIAGFEGVSSGAIMLAGRRIDPLPPSKRNVAMAFEGYSLYPPLTLRENIAFALKAARLDAATIEAKVRAVAQLLEIEGILDRYPISLSGGQQQRAGLARALVRRADLYLLDEPMSQLEPQLRAILRGRLKSYLIDNRMTVVFVTHDQTEASALADRIAVMEAGVLQQIASPAELKARPANLFVATFVGEPPMNVYPAVPVARDGRIDLLIGRGGGLSVDLTGVPAPVIERLRPDREVVLGVRPHQVRLGSGTARAVVTSCQWLGDETHVAAEIEGRLLVAVVEGRFAAAPGDAVPVSVASRDVHIFDKDTGAALAHGHEAVA